MLPRYMDERSRGFRIRLVVDDEVLRIPGLPMRQIFRTGEPVLETLEGSLIKLAPPFVANFELEELIAVAADVAIHAHFQKVDGISRIAGDPPLRQLGSRLGGLCLLLFFIPRIILALPVTGAPPLALAERLLLGLRLELGGSLGKVDDIVRLTRENPLGGADHPLQIAADVVREALAVKGQDAIPRALAIPNVTIVVIERLELHFL